MAANEPAQTRTPNSARQQISPALLVPMSEVGTRLGGLSRSSVYELVATGRLPTVRIGRRRFVTQPDLEAFVARLSDEPPAP
jgi:excisionase family DNA binding protein